MSTGNKILDSVIGQGILPLFFNESAEVSLETTRTLYKAGIRVIEYTNRGAAALENFKALKQAQQDEMHDLVLGIGTIKTVQQAEDFIAAGADFIIAPIVNPDVARVAKQHNLLWCPGCMTPTEIHLAQQNDAALIKLFPANVLGPGFVSAIKELFPGQLFMPTGGVELTLENIRGWFKSGVCAVGMGSKLISKDILSSGSYNKLYLDTQEALRLVQAAR
ncbi:MAG: bifunctional 4-hydroxy-2-oxoglutarate aldolase/2-dehydro-3-deoxy-phosphogluconate aldolase [Mucilaginibacter sp.]